MFSHFNTLKIFVKSQYLQVGHNYASILRNRYFKLTLVCPRDLDESENNTATNPNIPTYGLTMYSRTSMTRTLMARLPWLFRTLALESLGNNHIAADLG